MFINEVIGNTTCRQDDFKKQKGGFNSLCQLA